MHGPIIIRINCIKKLINCQIQNKIEIYRKFQNVLKLKILKYECMYKMHLGKS